MNLELSRLSVLYKLTIYTPILFIKMKITVLFFPFKFYLYLSQIH